MKVFRDIFGAVLIGIMGGLLVTTISYYNHHKEGIKTKMIHYTFPISSRSPLTNFRCSEK